VIPQAAREAAPQAGTHGQPMSADQRAQAGDGPLGESLRDEINDLRKQIADLAMERDVLMRSLALWVKGSTGE
jgi:transposase